MSIKIKIRRGTQYEVERYTTPFHSGEPVWIIDKNKLIVKDEYGETNIFKCDILANDLINLPRNKIYGVNDKESANLYKGFHSLDICKRLDVKEFYDNSANIVEEIVLGVVNSLAFNNSCTSSDVAYITFSPKIFDNKRLDVNFKLLYTLSDNTTTDKNIDLTFKVWQLVNGDIPSISSPDYTYTETIVTNAYDTNSCVYEFNLSSLKLNYIEDEDNYNNYDLVVIGVSRSASTDTYEGTFNLIQFTAYYANSGSEHGYYLGGYNTSLLSSIDRIHFPFDTGNAVSCETLSRSIKKTASCNSSIYGYIMGGTDSTGTITYSYLDKFEFPFNSGNILANDTISVGARDFSSCNSSVNGYVFGGYNSESARISNIDRFSFVFDTVGGENVGNLSGTNYGSSACNSSIHGFIFGGKNLTLSSALDRILFPFDSGTASAVGNLSYTDNKYSSGFNSSTHGFCVGGGSAYTSTVSRIVFPFDSGTGTSVGTINVSKRSSGCNSSLRGYAMGGENASLISSIESITFPFDPGSSCITEGNLSSSKSQGSSCDGIDFVTMFV